MVPIIEHTNIKNQSSILSPMLMCLPNNFKWNATGKMMQMIKHMADPIRPMMVSKLGIKIASTVMRIIKVVLIEPLTNRRA